jgi:hypothetical protein
VPQFLDTASYLPLLFHALEILSIFHYDQVRSMCEAGGGGSGSTWRRDGWLLLDLVALAGCLGDRSPAGKVQGVGPRNSYRNNNPGDTRTHIDPSTPLFLRSGVGLPVATSTPTAT